MKLISCAKYNFYFSKNQTVTFFDTYEPISSSVTFYQRGSYSQTLLSLIFSVGLGLRSPEFVLGGWNDRTMSSTSSRAITFKKTTQ